MKMILACLIGLLLLLCSYYDIKKRMIPNVLVLIILPLGLTYSMLYHSLAAACLGLLIPSLPLYLIKTKVHFIGSGDIKLLAAIGGWLGWLLNLYVFVMACLLALIVAFAGQVIFKKQMKSVAFAPFLTLSVMTLFYASLFL